MTEFVIGDEDYSEEINTTYDQDKDITDLPSAYFGVSGEPIDAKNGQGFMDIKKIGESLNKDGTGIAKATRGVDPTKQHHVKLKFVYVSKDGCDICKQYDGMVFDRNDEKRPIIPRLEVAGWSARPYTHPHCKCKWVRADGESYYPESDAYKECEYCGEQFWYDSHSINSENMAIHVKDLHEEKYHQTKLNNNNTESNEVDAKTMDRARKWYGNGFDELDTLEQKMAVINMLKQSIGMETKLIALESEPSVYGIQNMLDMIVEKSLNKDEKTDVVKTVKDNNFNLETLLDKIVDKLVGKLSKKLGVESISNEELIMRHRCNICKQEFTTQDEVVDHKWDEHDILEAENIEHVQHHEGYNKDTGEMECDKCEAKFSPNDDWQMSNYNKHMREHATEGGKGSGKSGHSPWMLGTYLAEECPNCLISTERNNGICTICGK